MYFLPFSFDYCLKIVIFSLQSQSNRWRNHFIRNESKVIFSHPCQIILFSHSCNPTQEEGVKVHVQYTQQMFGHQTQHQRNGVATYFMYGDGC